MAIGTITIDASGSTGIDLEAFLTGGFISDTAGGGFPSFDNSASFAGEEMFIGYGTDPASKYVFAHGALSYNFGTHTIAGEIETMEFGTRGTGAFDGNGYYVGGSAQLRITGLEFSNPVPTNATEEADIEANGLVHLFGIAHMYGNSSDPATAARVLDALQKVYAGLQDYAHNYIGSSGIDTYAGTDHDDTVTGGLGNDELDGGDGTDTAVFAGLSTDYTWSLGTDGVLTVVGAAGTDHLSNFEKLQFSDTTVDAPDDIPAHDLVLTGGTVAEDLAIDSVVGTLSATDPEGQALTFAFTQPNALFEIVGNEIRVKAALDFETTPLHTLDVKISDAGGNETTESVAITVTNVDEAPQNIALSNASVDENSANGTVVGTFSAFDPEGGALTYALTNNAGGKFALVTESGVVKLVVNGALNFETAGSHGVTVEVKDPGDHTASKDFTIAVGNVDEAPSAPAFVTTPTGSTLALGIAENSPAGTLVGYLKSTDPEGLAVTYQLTDDADGLFVVDGNQVKLARALGDFEAAASTAYNFTVVATDAGGKTTAPKTFTVQHADALDNPEGTLTIDASGMGAGGVNFSSFLVNFFAGLDAPAYNFYGGTADTNPYGPGSFFLNGDEIAFKYKEAGVDTNDRVVLGGTNLAYDFFHSGAQYGHGISGELDSLTFGQWTSSTTATEGILDGGLIDGLQEQLKITGLDLRSAVGTGSIAATNLVFALYNAVQSRDAAAISAVLSSYAQNFIGTTGNDVFMGSRFGDVIDGNGGLDILVGGDGTDTYRVRGAGSIVVENFGEGTDTVESWVDYTLGSNIEKLALQGTADLDGTGNEVANEMSGNSGINRLDGNGGADRLVGKLGNDTYVVDHAGDVVVEVVGEGIDTVESSVSLTLAANVDHLMLGGPGALNGFGNALANNLTGNAWANILDGRGGADMATGGAGNDTYFVDNALDQVVELAGGGTDNVRTTVSHVLAGNVENLILLGTAGINGTGNGLANAILGNSGINTIDGGVHNDVLDGGLGNDRLLGEVGNDRLIGGIGADALFGGANADIFVYRTIAESGSGGRDKIFDFVQAQGDRIDLSLIDANTRVAGNQAFTFIGTANFHKNVAGELRYAKGGGDVFAIGDVNGDMIADFSIAIDNPINLLRSDFIL